MIKVFVELLVFDHSVKLSLDFINKYQIMAYTLASTSFILFKSKHAAGYPGWAAQGMKRCDGQEEFPGDEDDLLGDHFCIQLSHSIGIYQKPVH